VKTLFLAWQDPISRTWFPIGKLTHANGLYSFVYLQGAVSAQQQANFQALWGFSDLHHCYQSIELFPLFSNRLLRSSRPDYQDFVQWLNLPVHQDDPIALLARSGGQRKTDSLEIFPDPEPDEQGAYHIHFFAHGLRHFPETTHRFVQSLLVATPLRIVHDVQNPVDSRALILRTDDLQFVGYCPRYLTQDLFVLLNQFPHQVSVTVERVNLPPTPLQFRLLCNLTAQWPQGFHPFTAPDYQPLVPGDFGVLSTS
jgi:hypothetical protein